MLCQGLGISSIIPRDGGRGAGHGVWIALRFCALLIVGHRAAVIYRGAEGDH
jgi:hypothetical protein